VDTDETTHERHVPLSRCSELCAEDSRGRARVSAMVFELRLDPVILASSEAEPSRKVAGGERLRGPSWGPRG
jgi:hypothetical protein